jgi:hypothetical protein
MERICASFIEALPRLRSRRVRRIQPEMPMAATYTWIALSYLAGALATYGILAGRLFATRPSDEEAARQEVRRWSGEVRDSVRK